MKLATIRPDGTAHCFLCRWSYRVSTMKKDREQNKKVEIPLEDRRKYLEKAVLEHLHLVHDKMLITREGDVLNESSQKPAYYHGRR